MRFFSDTIFYQTFPSANELSVTFNSRTNKTILAFQIILVCLVCCVQFNISEIWYTRENDVIGFANLGDVGMVTYTIDVTGGHVTRWAAATNTSSFPPRLHDVVLFNDTFARLFAIAVRVGQGM